jgi:hypothetical protein
VNRRDIIRLACIAVAPIPSLPQGPIEKLLLGLTYKGEIVSALRACEFALNTKMQFVFGEGNNFLFDGVAAYRDPGAPPTYTNTFDPIRLLPEDRLEITFVVRGGSGSV